jgi:hypothetical protein
MRYNDEKMNLKLTLDEKKACHNCNCESIIAIAVVKKFQNRPS